MRAILISCVLIAACGGNSKFGDDGGPGNDSGFPQNDSGFPNTDGGNKDGSPQSDTPTAIIRDFKIWDGNANNTNPDFENPPVQNTDLNDHGFVQTTLGADGVPAYALTGASSLGTVHSPQTFMMWYHDTPNFNLRVLYPIPLTKNADGSYGYDSSVSGVPTNPPNEPQNGFFPIDDGTPYQTAFGNQGMVHNYSFTVELHTTFTYAGGEYFNFRGDDDVFVFINKQLVIDLGGIHSPETASVNVDSLGLTKGTQYPLDFFSAERHKTGSNILFTTTLDLKPVPPPN
jgi:fibro-slime domain-containing protein